MNFDPPLTFCQEPKPTNIDKLKDHVAWSFHEANNDNSKLSQEILDIDGMSGNRTRHFYNNLCSMPDARYLEIGVWKGSSYISSMYQNEMVCTGMDNWSEFGGPKEDFLENFNKFKGKNNATFIDSDCWNVDPTKVGPFNLYLYDGSHEVEDHYKALNHFLPAMDDEFIFVVDDWGLINYNQGYWGWKVHNGTLRAIVDNNLTVVSIHEVLNVDCDRDGWWNGIAIFVLRKP